MQFNNFLECSILSEPPGPSNEEVLRRRVEQLEEYVKKHGLSMPTPENTPPVSPARPAYADPVVPKNFKLSSSVLSVTREGMVHKSLADIIMETSGRQDVREPDTPAGNISPRKLKDFGSDAEGSSDGSSSSARRRSLPDTVSVMRSSSAGKPPSSPAKKTVKKREKAPPPPSLDAQLLDRIATVHSLAALTDKITHKPFPPVSRQAMDYIASSYNDVKNVFTHDTQRYYTILKKLCAELLPIMEKEPMYVKQQSPCYAFGDTHGNYADVSYFLENIINFLDLAYTPCNLIFLGDYVDRGSYGLEVITLLLSLKLSNPKKVTLLRGNHEDPLVNGDTRHYGESAFQRQCQRLLGVNAGLEIWKLINGLFKHFPLAADIDGKIFCCHGGIPRFEGGDDNRLEMLQSPDFPHLDMFSTFEPATDRISKQIQMASDLCWSDPKDVEHEGGYWELNEYGFGNNSRGDGVICFGEKAIDQFCERYGFQYIFRAHQEKSDGLKLAKSARVITIFSSSDYEGHRNGAGVLFVNREGEIRMIMKTA
eukprot:TRINITY_DN7406_c0_g2_i1.p1 TRINITY_DN7406_c0_g2~~TRINITY_DN7406_c0_g2_i1.p1  ORF type:complete len:538 (+),score=108.70 TRINITY_DN7406_c0_g2_i1:66-1679(+)